MTALCGGGTSSAKSGVNPVITLTATAVDAFLAGLIDPVAATIIAGTVAASLQIDVNGYCGTDPPPDPGLTAADLLALAEFSVPSENIPAIAKTVEWFKSRYWYQICQCDAGGTPAPPTVSNPGPASQNPGLPSAQTGPCWDRKVPVNIPARVSTTVESVTDVASLALPSSGSPRTITEGATVSPNTHLAYPMPPSVTNMQLTFDLDADVTTTGQIHAQVNFYNSTGVPISGSSLVILLQSSGALNDSIVLNTPPASAVYWSAWIRSGDTNPHSGSFEFSFYCPGGAGSGLASPCCPPDPLIQQLLNQVIALENVILQSLPTPVHSWAESSAHSGLSNNGAFGISGNAIAIKVHLDSIPPAVGDVLDSPTFYFDVGYITFTTVEGSYSSQRITYADQVFSVPSLGFQVNYSLNFGVTATITELTRGP